MSSWGRVTETSKHPVMVLSSDDVEIISARIRCRVRIDFITASGRVELLKTIISQVIKITSPNVQ